MANNINGFGKVGVFDPVAQTWQALRTVAITLASDASSEKVQSFPTGECGPLITVDSKANPVSWTAGISVNSIDDNDLAVIFDQKWLSSGVTAINLPDVTVATIPLSTPYEITIAGLAVGDTVAANVLNDTSNGVNLPVTAAVVSPTNAQKVSGKVVFDASFAGKSVSIYRLSSTTPTKILGGNAPLAIYPEISFFGVFCSTRMSKKLYIPRLKRSNGASFDVTADSFDMEYDALVPSGWAVPYAIW
jgi:hypothetical protein